MAKIQPDLPRLIQAVQRSRLMLQRYRRERHDAVQQYAGHHWGEGSTPEKVPLNLLSLYCRVVSRNLIANNPRVLLSSFNRQAKPIISAAQSWANQELIRLEFAKTLRRIVLDALFLMGVAKVAIATPTDAATLGWGISAGEVVCSRVDPDDLVIDMGARDISEIGYIGHRYRAPLDVVKDAKYYSKARNKLEPSEAKLYNEQGDERIGTLGKGTYGGAIEEFEDFVDLWEIYLPRHRTVLTLTDDQLTGGVDFDLEPLREQPWVGPETGPYHILGYEVVPGNVIPKGPIQDLVDLHDATNRILRKIIRQGERMKEVVAVQGGATEDGKRTIDANDGDMTRVDNPERIKQLVFGGPQQALMGLVLMLRDWFSWEAGNLDMMGGLSPQSKTATQDELLAQAASKSIASLQDDTVSWVARVTKSMLWFWHHDPFKTMQTEHKLPSLPGFGITRSVTPEQRVQIPWEALGVKIDPYSMQHSTPQSRMAQMTQVVTQIVLPMMTLLQQQGVTFDVGAYLKKVGEYLDMPDLAEILTFVEPPMGSQGGQGGSAAPQTPGMPANTTRTYERISRPGTTPQSDNRDLMNRLMNMDRGGNPGGNGLPEGVRNMVG